LIQTLLTGWTQRCLIVFSCSLPHSLSLSLSLLLSVSYFYLSRHCFLFLSCPNFSFSALLYFYLVYLCVPIADLELCQSDPDLQSADSEPWIEGLQNVMWSVAHFHFSFSMIFDLA
jgi:hypothetical protein